MFRVSEFGPYFQVKRSLAVGNPSTLITIAQANPDRAWINITCQYANEFWVSTQPFSDATTADFALNGPDRLWFNWQRDGLLPTLPFWGMIGAASGTVKFAVMELVWMPPQSLEE